MRRFLLLGGLISLFLFPGMAQAHLYFPHVDTNSPWGTEIAIINTSTTQTLGGTLRAYGNDGQLIDTRGISLTPHGRRQITISDEFTNHTSIGYLILETGSSAVQGYTKFYVSGQYRVAVPAVREVNTGDIYLPHIASNEEWWTGVSILNTTSSSKTVTLSFRGGQDRSRTLAPGEHQAFTIRDLFNGQPMTDIESAVIENASGVVGLELFGSAGGGNQLSGVLIKGDTAKTIHYPHVASDRDWWTGIVAYNPSDTITNVSITPYTEEGTPLASKSLTIPNRKKFISTVENLYLPTDTAWFSIDSPIAITGFELFGTNDQNQLAGYTGVGISGGQGVFAKVEKDGWTGIAFVNIEDTDASVTLTAYNDNGTAIATQILSLASHAKEVRLAQEFFTQDIEAATYIGYSSDKEIVGFQLNGSQDDMMLDGLPGLAGVGVVP
jgi:hypothetical protein